jgi:tRNA nucleotidyltransferase (CCA-adding enzyme)
MPDAYWEHFPHQADVGVRGIGPTAEEAFEQAALALTAAVCDPTGIKETARVDIECEAQDFEMLLPAWLNDIVYEMSRRRMLFGRYHVSIVDHRLKGEAWGEIVDRARHRPAVEVKGATMSELRVRQQPTGEWIAQCVIDV